jgi:hypothetical protein
MLTGSLNRQQNLRPQAKDKHEDRNAANFNQLFAVHAVFRDPFNCVAADVLDF